MRHWRDWHKNRTAYLESLERRNLLAGDILITELVASNDDTLDDRDGESSDWLELFNNSAAPVNLNGWYLTDDLDELKKWRFPAVTMEPGEYKVVFASDKNRRTANGELHTNFKLSASGESLAIVEPNGRTISHQYDSFPRQQTDVAYGLRAETVVTKLISGDSRSLVLVPNSQTDQPSNVWTSTTFDDSAWKSKDIGVGFSDGDYTHIVDDGGELTEMIGSSSSAYVRIPFQITDPITTYDQLELGMHYDDGFVAYLNGTLIASRNAPTTLNYQSSATASHGGTIAMQRFDNLAAANGFTFVGDAVWNDEGKERIRLTGPEAAETGAAWTSQPIDFGPRFSFSASMQMDVTNPGNASDADGTGGHGMTFTLQSGGQFRLGAGGGALGLNGTGMQYVAVEFDTAGAGSFDFGSVLPTHIGINTSTQGNVARIAVPRFNGSDESNPRFVWVDYDGVTDQFDVYFSSTSDKPTVATLSTTLDLQTIFDDSTSLWAGWTAATGADRWNTHEVADFEISTTAELGLDEEIIDISDFISALRQGENVLAIHGLNSSSQDDDFLIKPRLTSTQSNLFDLESPGYFANPTPGEQNSESTAPPAGEVTYSETGRTFVDAFELTLRADSPRAVIRYTTDGSIPDEDSTRYHEPITIQDSTRLRARAFEPGKSPGPINSQGYIGLADSLADFEGDVFDSNLPLMVFQSFGGNVHSNATNLVPVSSVFINNTDGRASLMDEPEFAGRAGLRIRGQSSQGWAKKQYALEIWEEGNSDTRPISASRAEDRSVSFFGLPAESDWVLNGPYSDKTQLNNYLTFNWSNAMGQYAPRTRLVEVFVSLTSGRLNYRTDYRGTYVLLEKIKIDNDRVDITELSPGVTEEPEISGGYIWKYDKDGARDVNFTSSFQSRSGGRAWKFVEPQRPPREQRDWLSNHLRDFERALYGRNFDDPETGYANYIDVESWIDTWLLVEFTKNIDGFRLSTYYHKDRGGKIKQGPAWDYNLSLANANYLNGAEPTGWYHTQLSEGNYPYWDRLFDDPNFEIKVRDRWFELRSTIFSTASLLGDVDEAVGRLTDGNPKLGDIAPGEHSNPISRNFARWGTLGSYLWPNCFFGSGGCPPSPLPNRARPSKYADYIFILKNFIERRTAWIDRQFRAPPAITPQGGVVGGSLEVELRARSGDRIYYTLDGSDPRDPETGDIAETAVQYTDPIELTQNTVVQSRSLRTEWSAISAETYFVDIPTILISELNFNPADPSNREVAAGFADNDDFEFVELVNYGDASISLGGMEFTDGVQATLEDTMLKPGQRAVVVRDEEAFRFRYGHSAQIVGQYGNAEDDKLDFKLRNSGERLVMIGALGEPILDFVYQDDWYPLTDGDGFSLVRRTPITSDPNQANAWQASEFADGSPGSAELGLVPGPDDLVINEVFGYSDARSDVLEIANRTDRTITVGGYYISDRESNPQRFRIPLGTQIAANDFLLLDQQTLGTNFELGTRGGELIIRGAMTDGTQTGYSQTIAFGTFDEGQSWGRVETSDGSDFAIQSAVTLGATNASPTVGPVVINEIQYHPAASDNHEFIELKNISTDPVKLGEWRFDQGIRFQFPQSAELAPGGYALLIQIDDDDPANVEIAAFREQHFVPASVPIFVYRDADGSLSNAGETLLLNRPSPRSNQFIESDRITYSDHAPWTTRADGAGPSLSRVQSSAFGNDPGNWRSGANQGTPGRDNRFEDPTPPSTPANLAATITGDGGIMLGWTPSYDSETGVDHYAIYRNGLLVDTSPIGFFRDEDFTFTEDASWSYHVVAVNPDGFASNASHSVSIGVNSTSYQDGVDGYSGTTDTTITEDSPEENRGSLRRIVADGNAAGEVGSAASALLRWPDIGMPEGDSVVGVNLSVNLLNPGDDFAIRPLRKSWQENEVTWNQASDSTPWDEAGALGTGDVGSNIGTLRTSDREYLTTSLDSPANTVIQNWIDNPAENHGLIIQDPGGATDSILLASREFTDSSLRPKLTIFHAPVRELLHGDFNFDGDTNARDIDLLHAAIREGVNDTLFDLDSNGRLDDDDVDFLLDNLLNKVRGDADLNGAVEFADFLLLADAFGAGRVTHWGRGDFDGDGETTFRDFLLLAENFSARA